MNDLWYMDCFSPGALLGDKFPVNSYYHESLEKLMAAGQALLERQSSGVNKITFARETLGIAPMHLDVRPTEETLQ